MGRSAGWIAAGAALAKRRDHPHDPPHLILLPEIPFNQEKVLEDVRRVLKREKYCLIVVAEGLVDSDGNYVAADGATDAFGHATLGGAGDALGEIIGAGIPGRQGPRREARPHAALRDSRRRQDRRRRGLPRGPGRREGRHQRGRPTRWSRSSAATADHYTVRNRASPPRRNRQRRSKKLPREWINEDGVSMNFQFLRYAQPLITGEVTLPHDAGVPVFARLDKVRVDKVLPAYEA
jgi:6-phosphofructokinase 1